MTARLGAVEGGGSSFRCAISGDGIAIDDEASFETRDPDTTLRRVVSFFETAKVRAIGLAMFGPIELREGEGYGATLQTPKAAWSLVPVARILRDALEVPIVVETDVTAAALGEHRHGAAKGCDPTLYVTVGTGIGGGAVVNGAVLRGLLHPEIGHMRVPLLPGDAFEGACPFHGRCLEGLASGAAIAARTGRDPERLPDDHAALDLAARYVGLGLANVVLTLSPQRIVLGGGVMQRERLRARAQRTMIGALAGYIARPEILDPAYVSPPGLGARSALVGALELASRA